MTAPTFDASLRRRATHPSQASIQISRTVSSAAAT